jgi:transposase-like protein
MSKRKTFTRAFKLEAIRALDSGTKQAAELARELGIPRNRLYKWRDQMKKDGQQGAFPGQGRRAGQAAEIATLQVENNRLREENEILKKAARYFAKECP